jgi:hypothetical protein
MAFLIALILKNLQQAGRLKNTCRSTMAYFFRQVGKRVMKKAYLTLLTVLVNIMVFAQEKSTDINVDINKESGGDNWYASPWVWVLGAAIFIILLIALTSGGRSRSTSGSTDKVTVTKTVRRDTDA